MSATKTTCVSPGSTHFPTEEKARAEVFSRKINEASTRRAIPRTRYIERCKQCEQWVIVSPHQRNKRQSANRRRGR